MPYQPHTLVTFGGTLTEISAHDEIWQCGVRGFGPGNAPVNDGDLQQLAEVVLNGPTGTGGGISAIWGQANGRISTEAGLTWCKAANIAADGTYSAEPGIAQQDPVYGTISPASPEFVCVAISWTTGLTLGRGIRGRIYPPNAGAQRDVGSTIQANDVTGLASWAHDLLAVLDTSGLVESGVPSFVPYIVSKFGVSHAITGGRVGNVFDTQRRRKDKKGETYVSFAK